ncbi:MAG TPA: hypothetical protein VKB76_15775 [Ktedonobacterales bacterium]|nr:hypothetical protein [Ktedonobacterales bacterium]
MLDQTSRSMKLRGMIIFYVDDLTLPEFSDEYLEHMALVTEMRIAPVLQETYGGVVGMKVKLDAMPASDTRPYDW